MAVGDLTFAFRPELGETPETLARRRQVAEAMLGQTARTPRNVGEGLNALGAAIGGRLSLNRIGRAETAGRNAATDAFNGLFGGGDAGSPSGSMRTAADAAGVSHEAAQSNPMELAATLLGKNEVPDNAAIQDYLRTGGVNLDPATTAWCAAFVNSTLAQSGIKGTGSNMAKSFLQFGTGVDTPERGDIAVFSRGDPNGPYGHVGFFDSINPDGTIRVLGGNQGNAVSYSNYPANRLLGYRRAGGQTAVADALVGNTGNDALTGGGSPSPAPAAAAAPIQVAQAGPGRNQLLQVLANPWLSDQQRAIAQLLLEQEMQRSDPKRQLELEKLGLEVGNLRNPRLTPADKLARERFDFDKEQAGQTGDIKEYEYAKSQGYTGSFAEYQDSMKKAGASTVTVGGEKIPEKVLQAGIDASDQADVLEGQVQELTIFRDMASEADTGWSTPITLPIKQAFRSIGVDIGDEVPLLEAMQAQQNQMALRLRNPESGFGLTGNTSNQDVRFLKDAVAGIEKTPAGNRAVLTIMMAKQRREAMLARAKADYIFDTGSLAGWGARKKQLVDGAPFFEPGEKEFLATLKQQSAAPATGGAPAVGTVQGGYRFKGGNPADRNNWEPVMNRGQFDQRFGG